MRYERFRNIRRALPISDAPDLPRVAIAFAERIDDGPLAGAIAGLPTFCFRFLLDLQVLLVADEGYPSIHVVQIVRIERVADLGTVQLNQIAMLFAKKMDQKNSGGTNGGQG